MWGGQWDVRRFDEIASTNTYLSQVARQGAPEGVVAVADHQTAGRGRLDRHWEAPAGSSLLMSVLFRPELEPAHLHLCTAALALAAADACAEVAQVRPGIKWPNDLVVGEAKLAGILAEAEFAGDALSSVVVGIGVNVGWPGPPGLGGTCLDDVGGLAQPVDREVLLAALLSALLPRRALLDDAPGRAALADELRQRCITLGQDVRIDLASGSMVGRATDIDSAGHLVVETGEGSCTVTAGDVVHLRPR